MPTDWHVGLPAITGLPWSTWLLLLTAIVPALVLVVRFYAVHRDGHRSSSEREPDPRG